MLIRILFALLAVATLAFLFVPGNVPRSNLEALLFLLAFLVLSLGMAIPWGRWIRLEAPDQTLAFLSKLLGWGGVVSIPVLVVARWWPAIGLCVLVTASSIGVWKGRLWAAWTWYAVSGACFFIALASLVVVFTGEPTPEGSASYAAGERVGSIFRVVLWGCVGYTLAREFNAWRRKVRSRSMTPDSAPVN